ncbi:kinase-like domain-containing protein [Dichotomocladium elegans]|nr:kinase-like domain-containing protein [Dichotomocladium elegans]
MKKAYNKSQRFYGPQARPFETYSESETKQGSMHIHRLLLRREIEKEILKKYGIGNNSKRTNVNGDFERNQAISSVTSNFEGMDNLQKCSCPVKPMVIKSVVGPSEEHRSSVPSGSLSEQGPVTQVDNTRSTAENAQSLLPSLVLDIQPEDLVFEEPLGEGEVASVMLAKYRNVRVACKVRRECKRRKDYESDVLREIAYSAKLSACRFMNPCIGVLRCRQQKIKKNIRPSKSVNMKDDLCLIQRYYENGDLRDYIASRQGVHLHHVEVLQIGLSLFAGLSDAHKLGVGIVDLKLENILVDVVGSAWFTDFGSCIDFDNKQVINLDSTGVKWTEDVAAPEMLKYKQFSKESDVFMCAVILAEVMTPSLSDEEFARDVLGRSQDGSVAFNKEKIHPMYKTFMQLLEKALSNEPLQRPTAETIYKWLHETRGLSMEFARKKIAEEMTIE